VVKTRALTGVCPKPLLRRRLFQHTRGRSYEWFPKPEIALICEKTALLFSEYSILVLIWPFEAESKLKITATSTCCEADNVKDGLEEGELKGRGANYPEILRELPS
jgi:hypothetical protein